MIDFSSISKIKIVFYISLFIVSSCKNEKEEMIAKLIYENNRLMNENTYLHNNNYMYREKESNYLNNSRIKIWEQKANKIDNLYKPYYEKDNWLVKDFGTIIYLCNTTNKAVFKILKIGLNDPEIEKKIEKDSSKFIKNDSLNLTQIYNSSFSDSIKSLLFNNFFRKKSFEYQEYCDDLSPHVLHCLKYLRYSHIALVDKNILLPGQKVEAFVGVGEINRNSNPKFYINKKYIEPDIDGIAKLTITAPKKVGIYKIPVKIIELSEDGEYKTHSKELEFQVIDTFCK